MARGGDSVYKYFLQTLLQIGVLVLIPLLSLFLISSNQYDTLLWIESHLRSQYTGTLVLFISFLVLVVPIMHIINAFLRMTSLGAQNLSSWVGLSDSSSNENQPLLDPNASLTSEYQDFSHSNYALKLCLGHMLTYYGFAVLGFSFLVEQWSIINSIYYSTVLFTTIGYGDLTASNRRGHLYTIFLAIYGIVILGIFLGVVGEMVVKYYDQAAAKRSKKISEQVLKKFATESVEDSRLRRNEQASVPKQKTMFEEIWAIFMLELPIILILVLIASAVGYTESWTWMESVYWLVITGTTVGFGDVTPKKESSRLFCIFFLPFVVAVLGELLARIASAYLNRKRRQTEVTFMNRSLAMCDIERMDSNADGKVDRAEFMAYMLVALQKVSKDDCDEIMKLFNKLDIDKSNHLDKNDLIRKDWTGSMRETMRESILVLNAEN